MSNNMLQRMQQKDDDKFGFKFKKKIQEDSKLDMASVVKEA